MRNYVAKNDFNRSSVHTDQKKAWEPDVLDGLEEHFLEIDHPKEDEELSNEQKLAVAEYARGVKASGIV